MFSSAGMGKSRESQGKGRGELDTMSGTWSAFLGFFLFFSSQYNIYFYSMFFHLGGVLEVDPIPSNAGPERRREVIMVVWTVVQGDGAHTSQRHDWSLFRGSKTSVSGLLYFFWGVFRPSFWRYCSIGRLAPITSHGYVLHLKYSDERV